jgi:hypothetical protein
MRRRDSSKRRTAHTPSSARQRVTSSDDGVSTRAQKAPAALKKSSSSLSKRLSRTRSQSKIDPLAAAHRNDNVSVARAPRASRAAVVYSQSLPPRRQRPPRRLPATHRRGSPCCRRRSSVGRAVPSLAGSAGIRRSRGSRRRGRSSGVWGAQLQFRPAVQDWVNSLDFAHSLRGLGAIDIDAADLIFARASTTRHGDALRQGTAAGRVAVETRAETIFAYWNIAADEEFWSVGGGRSWPRLRGP